MAKKTLCIYVDESGNVGDTRDSARYCMITFVFHDAADDFSELFKAYEIGVYNAGADPEAMLFHTSPLIRQEDQFSAMSRNMRGKIFYQMLSFVRKCALQYKSIWLDTNFIDCERQIVMGLQGQLREFIIAHHPVFADLGSVSLHYDAGQKGVGLILNVLTEMLPCPIEIVQGVTQNDYVLLQVADFLCTMNLMEIRISDGVPFNLSEKKFFGSPRDFYRNVLRKLKSKEMG